MPAMAHCVAHIAQKAFSISQQLWSTFLEMRAQINIDRPQSQPPQLIQLWQISWNPAE